MEIASLVSAAQNLYNSGFRAEGLQRAFLHGGAVTTAVATLSLEPYLAGTRRRTSLTTETAGLREFVLGPENLLVRQAIGLQERTTGDWWPDCSIVPLLIYGPSGLGKTQLLQALAAAWTRAVAPERVLLESAADFARGLAHAQKLDDVPIFQQRHQRMELLLIDNLEQLLRKSSAQEQLATIIDHRQRRARPTVLAARQSWTDLGLSARLTSRLASGLTIPIATPSAETRREVAHSICRQRGWELAEEAADILCAQTELSIPELVGILSRAASGWQSRLDEHVPPPVERAQARQAATARTRSSSRIERPLVDRPRIDGPHIQSILPAPPSTTISPSAIVRATALHFGLKNTNLTGTSRRKLDVLARSLAMHLMRELTGQSFQQIGRYFGRRDHSTVMHACRKIAGECQTDAAIRQATAEIRQRIDTLATQSTHKAANSTSSRRRSSKAN